MRNDDLIIKPDSQDEREIEEILSIIGRELHSRRLILQAAPQGMVLAKIQSEELHVSRALAVVEKVAFPEVRYRQVLNNTNPDELKVKQ